MFLASAFAGIAGRLRDASSTLDIRKGEDRGKGEVAAGVRGPRVCEEGDEEEGIAALEVIGWFMVAQLGSNLGPNFDPNFNQVGNPKLGCKSCSGPRFASQLDP